MISNLFDRLKLPFRKDKELYSSLYDIMGFYPHDLEIYKVALAHKSADFRNSEGKRLDNERLEFLGDAILEAAVSDIVFHHFKRKREGFLTSTRSKLVQRKTLNSLATEIGLERLIKTTARASSHNSYLGGNAFEALVGAIYLDRGYRYSKWFIARRIIGRLIDIDGVAHKEVNFKSKLLEWSQKNRINAEFLLDDTVNAGSNSPEFRTKVVIEGLLAGQGSGFSKKESQQKAAKEALIKLRREPQFIDRIFRAKEKRTAMEADEFSAVPRIEEIEEKIAQMDKRKPELRTERPVKNRTRRKAREAAEREAAATAPAAPENAAPAENTPVEGGATGEKPARAPRRRSRRKPAAAADGENSVKERGEQPAERGEKPAERDKQSAERGAAVGENPAPQVAPSERGEAAPAEAVRADEGNARRPRRPRRVREEDAEAIDPQREAIIRAAEDAAFGEA